MVYTKSIESRQNEEKKSQRVKIRIFNPSIDYDLILNALKEEFEEKWQIVTPSLSNGLEMFQVIKVLGVGAFGTVNLVKHKMTLEYSAAKSLSKEQIIKNKQIVHAFNEKRVLKSMTFPFLMNLVYSTKDFEYLYLGMPYISGGELFKYLSTVGKLSEKQARFYAGQVFLGLEYLHNVNILYRDIKPENIVIDKKGFIKLTDFGFAKRVETRTLTLCGTPEYIAPEIIQSIPYGKSVDWWSFGIFLFDIVRGKTPFSRFKADPYNMYEKICIGRYNMPQSFTPTFQNLIYNLLQVDMTKRMGVMSLGNREIKNHPWFETIDWFELLNQKMNPPYIPYDENIEDMVNIPKNPVEKKQPVAKIDKFKEEFADF